MMLSSIKSIVKRLLFHPYGMRIGRDATVKLPRWIRSADRITIGNRTHIQHFAVLIALSKYENKKLSSRIDIGNDVYIGGWAQIHAMDRISIGDGSVLSEHVFISDIAHGMAPDRGLIMKQDLESKGPVSIGEHCFIGFGSSVLPGITLGDHCIVGTRSVVTRSFPGYSMIAGSPARLVKTYDWVRKCWVSAG
jgi:acetyltransferase-like isoleucine patch superfamily enzyme